eukprot:1729152-Prymnesium_polylepis.1
MVLLQGYKVTRLLTPETGNGDSWDHRDSPVAGRRPRVHTAHALAEREGTTGGHAGRVKQPSQVGL